MPNRIIKESALDSEDLDKLSNGAERLFWRLIVVADDFGRFEGSPQVVKARCFPRKVDTLRTSEVQGWMNELAPSLVRYYQVNGRQYGFFINWLSHQQKRANKSKFPDPPQLEQNQYDSNCNQLQSNVPEIEIESEIEIRDREVQASPILEKTGKPKRNAEIEHIFLLAKEIAGRDRDRARELCNFVGKMVKEGARFRDRESIVHAAILGTLQALKAKAEKEGRAIDEALLWPYLQETYKRRRTRAFEDESNQHKRAGVGSVGQILAQMAAVK